MRTWPQPADFADVRATNFAVVLRHLRMHAPCSRADIAAATMLVLDGSPYAAIGMEVNADYMTVVALDLAGRRLLSWRRAFAGSSTNPGQSATSIAALAKRAVAKVEKEGRRALGLTVGVPGWSVRTASFGSPPT
jgi:hypothetical protein